MFVLLWVLGQGLFFRLNGIRLEESEASDII